MMKKMKWLGVLKLVGLLALISLEAYWATSLLKSSENRALKGALSKEGKQYVVRWLNEDKTVGFRNFESPLFAMAFAQGELGLIPGKNPVFDDQLEHVWLRKEMGKQVMLWKTARWDQVHRLTFQNEQHARLFLAAFKQGAYSPSPLGHAIHLKRQ